MGNKNKSRAGCLSIFFFLTFIWAIFSYFRDDIEQFKMRNNETAGITWYEAMETCKEMYRSLAEYGAVIPNCRKRTENSTEFTFKWNRSVPILLKNEFNEKIKNTGTCTVSKTTGEISYIKLNNTIIQL